MEARGSFGINVSQYMMQYELRKRSCVRESSILQYEQVHFPVSRSKFSSAKQNPSLELTFLEADEVTVQGSTYKYFCPCELGDQQQDNVQSTS